MKAKTLLGIHEKASISEIKSKYKNLMKKWHPDANRDDLETATQMSAKINEAYTTVMQYCNSFEYPFDEESLKRNYLSPQEWWEEKFGTKKDTI
jgi:DnaJ-class molecular chaperone